MKKINKKIRCLYKLNNEVRNAAPKAPNDVNSILKDNYNAKLVPYYKGKDGRLKSLKILLSSIFTRDILVIQFPFIHNLLFYKLMNPKRSILFIHDINGLRGIHDLDYDLKRIKCFKYIVVHNNRMRDYLISKGINKDYLYNLDLFDYLCDEDLKEIYSKSKTKNICYTGNLTENKSPFIRQIDDSKMKFNLKLYGLGIDKDISKHVTYHGSFEPEHINVIEGDLGLIWDGNIGTDDSEYSYKNYTKYNNPHKLSCYIARGIPVIVWEEAAISEFVKKYNIGYTIKDFYDINNINYYDYDKKKKNVINLSKKVRSGYFTKRVLDKVLDDMNKKK